MESIDEIKQKLEILRKENRKLSLEQHNLFDQINELDLKMEEMQHQNSDDSLKLEKFKMESATKIQEEVNRYHAERISRRKDILSDIHNQLEINKKLENEISQIQDEIIRLKEIRAAYPSKYIALC